MSDSERPPDQPTFSRQDAPWAPAPNEPGTPAPSDIGPRFQPVQTPPAEPGPPWAIAIVVVLLVAVLGVLVYMLLSGGQVASTPSPSPSPRPTAAGQVTPAPSASPSPSAGATDGPSPSAGTSPPGPRQTGLPSDVAAQIDRVVAQVPPIREIEPESDVPYELITREQFQADLQELLAEETDPELLATEERLLKRMGLLPPEIDLAAALEELYGSQVAAFYRPDTKTFYVITRDIPFGPLDRIIVAHEYTHALQDQQFDLEGTRITDLSEGDAALAQLAVIEGDATLVMFEWATQNLSFNELFEIAGESLSPTDQQILEDMPPILRRQLEFPYTDGWTFATEIQGEGGWSAIDAALAEPPPSTEQILHVDKFRSGEEPVDVELADASGALGPGWAVEYEQTFGELISQVWVAGGEEGPTSLPGLPVPPPHAEVAAGWGGDRLQMYEGPDGGWAIAWETAWDTQADVDEFAERARELRSTLDGESSVVVVPQIGEPDRVRVLLASDEQALSAIFGALGT